MKKHLVIIAALATFSLTTKTSEEFHDAQGPEKFKNRKGVEKRLQEAERGQNDLKKQAKVISDLQEQLVREAQTAETAMSFLQTKLKEATEAKDGLQKKLDGAAATHAAEIKTLLDQLQQRQQDLDALRAGEQTEAQKLLDTMTQEATVAAWDEDAAASGMFSWRSPARIFIQEYTGVESTEFMKSNFDKQEDESSADYAARQKTFRDKFTGARDSAMKDLEASAKQTVSSIMNVLGGTSGETSKRVGQLFTIGTILGDIREQRPEGFDIDPSTRAEIAGRAIAVQQQLEAMLAQVTQHVHRTSLNLTVTAQEFDPAVVPVRKKTIDFVAKVLVRHKQLANQDSGAKE